MQMYKSDLISVIKNKSHGATKLQKTAESGTAFFLVFEFHVSVYTFMKRRYIESHWRYIEVYNNILVLAW